jgi:hypothetical protein
MKTHLGILTLQIFTILLLGSSNSIFAETKEGAIDRDLPHYDHTIQLESTSETSANVEFGDLNGDGNLDIILAKGRHWPLVNRVLLGDGMGGF